MTAETRDFHTRLLRLSLACDESRAYWEQAKLGTPAIDRSHEAFEQRWFGSKSMPRVRYILLNFTHRFDAFPEGLAALRLWRPDPISRQNICHWHAQLTDPLYRDFSGQLLVERRSRDGGTVDRDVAARWVDRRLDGKWASATTLRMATALVTCAIEAGLCTAGPGTKTLRTPKVTDEALAYLLYLLRAMDFEGTLTENPYLASVGLTEGVLEQRLRRLPGLAYHRMHELQDFGWAYPDVEAWAEGELKAERAPA